MRHFLSVLDFNKEDYVTLLASALEMKAKVNTGQAHPNLAGKTLGMIFEKPSNRTRVSFEVGMFQLGGHAVYIQKQDIGMGSREPIADVSRVLSRYVDAVVIRCMSHQTLLDFSKYASVPVINGLSDTDHPCQALADILTILEHKKTLEGLKICYVGDGNNVSRSLMQLGHMMGMDCVIASPKGYQIDCPGVFVTDQLHDAVKDADVIYTDVWVSMGQEAETETRMRDFKGYEVNDALMVLAKPDAIFMHCLPAQRGLEVSDSVMESPNSVVFDQAENRMHAQKAILAALIR